MDEPKDTFDDLPLFSHASRYRRPSTDTSARLDRDSGLSAGIAAWGKALADAGLSIHTVKAFTSDLRLLARFVGGGQSLHAVGTHDLRNFLDWMLHHRRVPCSPKTYARRITSIKAFFRWLNETGILPVNPSNEVPQQSVLSPLPEVLTPEEQVKVLETTNAMRVGEHPDARPYTLLSLLLHTGIKKGECLSIHLNQIDLLDPEGPVLFIRYGDVRKRYKERKLPLPAEWVPAYREYLAQYSLQDRLFPWSPRRLEYLLEDIGQATGLRKHLSFDMCRWSCALADYRAGKDRDKIRQRLGLSKIQWREIGNKLDRLAIQEQSST